MSESPIDGKSITKKTSSKKQDFKTVLNEISNLESKVDLMFKSFEKINKLHTYNQIQNDSLNQLKSTQTKSANIPNGIGMSLTPSAFPTMALDTPILPLNPITPSNVEKELLSLNTPKPPTKHSGFDFPSRSPSPSTTNRDTPLNLLADVITNQYEQRLIADRIQDNTNQLASAVKEEWDKTTSPYNQSLRSDISSPLSSHIVLNTITETDALIKHNWNTVRRNIPLEIKPIFDSIDLNNMYVDSEREKKIHTLLELMQIPKIPTLKIMTKMMDIFLKMNNLYVILPIEIYDLFGILNKWKVDGFKSLNHSHLLLLNAGASFVCKEIKTTLFTNPENNPEYYLKIKNELKGFEQSLTNRKWLEEWEDYFLVNSYLHYQSISMFPDGLASVQGVLLLSLYIKLSGLNLSCSVMQTTAIRICQDLGLHSEKFLNVVNKNKKHLIDKKKKLWWFCCFSDEMLSMIYSKPTMIIHYTSSIKFLHDGKSKIIEVLENELHREELLKEAHDKAHKFQDNLDNSEIIDNLKTQIQNTIISIYKEDGIYPILKYYFFKIVNIFQNNRSKQEKKWDSAVLEQLLDDFIVFSNSLPDIIKDPESNDVWGDDCLFVYFIHLTIYFVQDHSYQLLYSTENSKTYVDFMKSNIELITKIKNCKKAYNAMSGCFDEILFTHVLRIIEYYSIEGNFKKKEALEDFEMIKTHVCINMKMNRDRFERIIKIRSPFELEHELSQDDGSVQSLDGWLRKKQIILIKLMAIFDAIIESNTVQKL
ncbi:unnamed protein product [Hanseniaspora opuntiae]